MPLSGLRTADSGPILYTPPHLADRILSGKAALEGERKIVTVLFADIKGSMDIMERLDPEEAKQLLDPCLQRMMEAVHRVEGTVNRILGDGIMVLFGAPLALEDHAQRALSAALLMHDAVARYAIELREHHGISLQIRVGVNTGEVVVRTISNNLYMDYSAVGHAVGLAARMESLATPGSTLVTVYTYRLAHDFFRFAARGAVKVKGVKEPLETYELLGPGASHSRLAARATQGLSPFVGRARELAQLQEILAFAGTGRGQVVSLVGEAGIGKSRLLEELKPVLRARGYLLIEGAAFPYGKTRAYLPLIDMLKRYCELSDQDSPDLYRERVRSKLTAVDVSLTAYVPVLLELLGIDSGNPQTASLPAEARLQKILEAIKRLIASQSRGQPVALLIEDLHWLDARSLTFLHSLTIGVAALPVVLLCTYRPGNNYPWEEQSFVHRIQISPLQRETSTSLFTALVGTDPAVAALAPLVYEQSGGNPFFLEEIVRSLSETGTLTGQPGAYTLARPLSEWTLPATIHGVLASRLDRLPPALKGLLQTAAVIGREVARPLLAQVAGLDESELDQALTTLQARELLYETAVYPDPVYTFKHALTQEVAYRELLHERRALLHETVGTAVEALYGDRLAEHVTLLAYHYSRSTNTDKALHYLHLAGQRAFDLYADTDALHFWEEYLRLLTTLPPSAERDRQELRTRLHLIDVLSRQKSDDGPIRAQFDAADAACQRLNDPRLLVELNATLAVAYVLRGQPRLGLTHASMAKHLADSLNDVHLQAMSRGPLAHLLWIAGRFSEGLQVAEEGLALLQRLGLSNEQRDFVASPHVQCLAITGACRGFLGDFEQGISALQQAAAGAAQHGHRISQALSHWGLALLYALRGEISSGVREAERSLTVMQEIGSTTGILLAGCVCEYFAITYASPPTSSAPTPLTPCLTQTWQEKLAFHELAGPWLAAAALRAGRYEEALQIAKAALVQAEASESMWFLCIAHLTLGRLFNQLEARDEVSAETHLLAALQHAEELQSRPFCTHILLALGELLGGKTVRRPQSGVRSQKRNGTIHKRNRAREYLTRAAELGEMLGMHAAREHAVELLARLEARSVKQRGKEIESL
ncbi:MAG TPA: adenylate/guanylate cyclase domain-containing protein [Candidatus Binatia bacterium]|nr:adenylate/guanylate cyclase domain-containing protein [Candidatus Binatia bacterium]